MTTAGPEDVPVGVDAGAEPAPATRSRTGQLLRELAHSLTEASKVLSDEPSSEAVGTAVTQLQHAREALSLLALERAAPEPAEGRPVLADAPALLRRTELDRSPTAPQTARALLKQTCAEWAVADEVTNAAIDVASELVTNAVQHSEQVVVLAVELRTDALVLSVWDDGPGRPRVLPYRAGRSERGIGLRLVKQLSERWGWTDEQHGKWVWSRLALPDADDRGGHARHTSRPGRRGPHRH